MDPDNRYSAILGGVQTKSDATVTNLQQAIGYPQQPAQFTYALSVQPDLMCGVVNSATGVWNVETITAQRETDGSISLRVSVQGAPIVMVPTAAGAKVAVGGDTQLVAANATRRYLCLINTSTGGQRITITFGAGAAVIDQGITLYPQGSYEMTLGAGNLSTQEVRAIASAAGGQISVQEGN